MEHVGREDVENGGSDGHQDAEETQGYECVVLGGRGGERSRC